MTTRIKKTDLARDALYDKVNTMIDEVNTKIDNKDSLPSQTGNAGKFLTTDGTNASWGKVKQIEIKQDLTNPSADTVPSTKAVSDESSRLESIMSNKIGEITSFVCSSTYIPIGCLPCNGGEYSKEQFKDLWNNYLVAGKLLTCTYTEYANDISNYGQCAKFAIDTTNNKFKVPTIKDGSYITQGLSDTELGKSYKESLPNIRANLVLHGSAEANLVSGAYESFYGELGSTTSYRTPMDLREHTGASSYGRVAFDASRSSSAYQDGAKVQGNNIRLRFFVVVANGEINQSVMDWSAWATSLNGKMDKDASNITSNAKSTISGWSMPSSRYIDLTLAASGSTYTAPANGYIAVGIDGVTNNWINFNAGNYFQTIFTSPNKDTSWVQGIYAIGKGYSVNVSYGGTSPSFAKYIRFYYAEGEE